MFDDLVGKLVKIFKGDIIVTSDHGHMDGVKGIPCYGHHVYENAIKIPLITPNYFGKKVIDTPLSNIQLKEIILNSRIIPQKYVYSDSQYFLQPNRKLAIIRGNFKYIYNKRDKSEELYDLKYDRQENINLLINKLIDVDRLSEYFLDEVIYYPDWKRAKSAYEELRAEKNRIWKEGKWGIELIIKARDLKRCGILRAMSAKFKPKKVLRGRWGALAKIDLSKK